MYREVRMTMNCQPEGTDQLATLANQIRSGLLSQSKHALTEPAQPQIEQMLQYMDMITDRGIDQAAFLTAAIKLFVTTAVHVLPSEQVDRMLMEVVGLKV